MKKILRPGLLAVFITILMCFFYRFIMYGTNDFDEHYRFAFELLRLRELSLKEFLTRVEYSHILAYPLWHVGFLVIFYSIQGVLQIFSVSIDMRAICSFSASVICTACVVCTFIIVQKLFARYFVKKQDKKISILAMMVMFVGPLYLPGMFSGYYVGTRTGSIWHNPTYLIVKPFALLIFFLYYEIFKEFAKDTEGSKKEINKRLLLASVLLLISSVAKPSFYQMFLPGLVLYCLIELVRSRGKSFFFLLKIALSVIPVTIVGIVQIFALSTSSQDGSIGIGFLKVWAHWTPYWYIALIISLAFPIGVMFLMKQRIVGEQMFCLALCTFVSGAFQYMFLYIQKDPFAGDFGWGFNLAVFILFIVSVISFENLKSAKENNILYPLCKIIFVLHFIFGILYFYDIFRYLEYMNPLSL